MIQERLNKIKNKISNKDFLEGKGMGNEINFHIFDYEPQYELQVRAEIEKIKKNFVIEDRKIVEVDLYKLLIEIMPIMFIPAGVKIMASWSVLEPMIVPVSIITVVVLIVVMIATGRVSQAIIRLDSKKEGEDKNE